MGKILCRNPGGQVTPLPLPGGAHADINVSQGNVATYARSGGIFKMYKSCSLMQIYQGIFYIIFIG